MKICLWGVKTSPLAVSPVKPVRKQGFVFVTRFARPVFVGFNKSRTRSVAVKTLPPAYEQGGSGACPKPRGLKAIAIV